jgi:uncharacterized protein (TIGR01777 family)
MKIFITGGTGFLGSYLAWLLREKGHQVLPQSRSIDWSALDGCDAVINLAGESIARGRWTERRKKQLWESRIETTRRLVSEMAQTKRCPKILISGSAVGFYGDRGDEELNETSAQGKGFLAGLCVEWEKQALHAQPHGARVVLLRTGVVMGPGGGALSNMALPFKLFAGGPVGTGKQWFPWISREDWAGIVDLALRKELSGPLNACAEPVRQKDFAAALGKALGRPSWLPAPWLGLRLVVGELANELVASQKVKPGAALAAGYSFRLGLDGALRAAL